MVLSSLTKCSVSRTSFYVASSSAPAAPSRATPSRRYFKASVISSPPQDTISRSHIRMLLKGITRLDTPRFRKAPVSLDVLEPFFLGLSMNNPSEQAFWGGGMCLAFFFLLRRSEIVAFRGGPFKWFALRAQDTVIVDAAGQPTQNPSQAQAV
ncbi:hypothetical protein PI124_g18529 [Phytophthora idaei]|nr:hypothetical protein PI124_g18529 [Phytophthora idaei]